jgi:hypothetical protein
VADVVSIQSGGGPVSVIGPREQACRDWLRAITDQEKRDSYCVLRKIVERDGPVMYDAHTWSTDHTGCLRHVEARQASALDRAEVQGPVGVDDLYRDDNPDAGAELRAAIAEFGRFFSPASWERLARAIEGVLSITKK